MDELSEFLLYAALLLELKSQRLLPGPDDVDADEETLGWEERDVLLARLLELRAYAAVADALARQLEAGALVVPRIAGLDEGIEAHAPDLSRACTPPTSPRRTCGRSRTARARAVDSRARDRRHRHGRRDRAELAAHAARARLAVVPRARGRGSRTASRSSCASSPCSSCASSAASRSGRATRSATCTSTWLREGDDASSTSDWWTTMQDDELRFALEAMVLVAIEPVPASVLADLLTRTRRRSRAVLGALRDELATERRGFQLQETASGWRLVTHPDAHDARPALRQPRRLAPALDRRARDARDRRVPPARLARPDRRAARRERRRRRAAARAARLHRGEGARRGPRPAGALRHDRAVLGPPRAALARRAAADRRVPRGPRGGVGRSPASSRSADGAVSRRGARATASGSRRCSPARATARGGACEELIEQGRVRVDGEVARLGRRVDPDDGPRSPSTARRRRPRPGLVYYLLNKPAGVVTTADDPQGRPTVLALVPAEPRVFPVGRLDRATEGLLDPHQRRRPRPAAQPPVARRREGVPRPGATATPRPRRSAPARGGAARRRDDRPARVSRVAPGPAAHRHPRGPQPPGAPDVQRRRPRGPPPRAHADRPGRRLLARTRRVPRAHHRRGAAAR